jgi:hypothetical protein
VGNTRYLEFQTSAPGFSDRHNLLYTNSCEAASASSKGVRLTNPSLVHMIEVKLCTRVNFGWPKRHFSSSDTVFCHIPGNTGGGGCSIIHGPPLTRDEPVST